MGKFKTFYFAKYKLGKLLSEDFNEEYFGAYIYDFEGFIETFNRLLEYNRVSEIEAKYMLILLNVSYMLDLKVPKVSTFKELLTIWLALFYTADILNQDNVYYDNFLHDIYTFIIPKIHIEPRPDIIFMLIAYPDKNIRDKVKSSLEMYEKEDLFELDYYLKKKGYFKEYMKLMT